MIRRLVLPVILALGVQVVLLALLQQSSLGQAPQELPLATLCVHPSGGSCYTRIQDAIDAADYGDLISVSGHTYHEHITMKDGVSIHGQGWSSTIIDGGYSEPRATVHILPGVSAGTVLSGVQVTGGGTGGVASSVANNVLGGGIAIWNSSPSIVDTWVYSCTAKHGGGVYVNGGSPIFDNVPVWSSEAQDGGGFYLHNGADVTITGNPFAGTNGTVWFNSATDEGGGLYLSGVTATLMGLRVNGNAAHYGGGVNIHNTPNRITLLLNDISGNTVSTLYSEGGGIRASQAANLQIGLNTINENTARDYGEGGGVALYECAGLVQWNWFLGNRAMSGDGGGLSARDASTGLVLRGNWLEGNSAQDGGGLNIAFDAVALVDANTIVSNTAGLGAGIHLVVRGTVTMTNNIVARNSAAGGAGGGGVAIFGSPGQLINNTIADNTKDGVWFADADGVVIVNNIICGNSGDGIERHAAYPTTVYTADYNDVYDNDNPYLGLSPGANDLAVNPKFVGSGVNLAAHYHIQDTSPVSVTGSIGWAPERDFDGDLRILGGSVSMGADEIRMYGVFLPLVLR